MGEKDSTGAGRGQPGRGPVRAAARKRFSGRRREAERRAEVRREEGDFFWILAARKPTGAFFVLPLRGRPLADMSRARVARKAASSKNPPVISARRPRQNPKEIPNCHVLRTADNGGVIFRRRMDGQWFSRKSKAFPSESPRHISAGKPVKIRKKSSASPSWRWGMSLFAVPRPGGGVKGSWICCRPGR